MIVIVGAFFKFYLWIGIISILIYLIIFYSEILPTIRKRTGVGILNWLTNLKRKEDLEKYKHVCIQEGKSLIFYKFLRALEKYTLLYLIGWFVLINLLNLF